MRALHGPVPSSARTFLLLFFGRPYKYVALVRFHDRSLWAAKIRNSRHDNVLSSPDLPGLNFGIPLAN